MSKIQLRYIAQARSGDKGNTSDINLFAPNQALYELFKDQITADMVKRHLQHLVEGEVVRYEVPNLHALKFLCRGALNGGAASSIRVDNLGKCFSANLLRMEVDVPDEIIADFKRVAPEPLIRDFLR